MTIQTYTRLFFVVDSWNDNEEIYETLEQAEKLYYLLEKENSPNCKPRLYIAMVKNAYQEGSGWNYDDFSDTFQIIEIIK